MLLKGAGSFPILFGASWTPATATTGGHLPALWALDDQGMYQQSNGTSAVSSGTPIGYATDLSGNGRHAIQSTTGAKPTYIANAQNGRGVARFDGGDWLGAAAPTFSNYTIFCVRSSSATGAYLGISSSSTQFLAGYHINTGKNRHNYKNSASEISGGTFDVNASNGAFVIVEIDRNGTTFGNSVNGSRSTATATIADITQTWMTVGAYRLAESTVVLPFTGDIAAILIYAAALDATDRAQVETYLNTRWAVY